MPFKITKIHKFQSICKLVIVDANVEIVEMENYEIIKSSVVIKRTIYILCKWGVATYSTTKLMCYYFYITNCYFSQRYKQDLKAWFNHHFSGFMLEK